MKWLAEAGAKIAKKICKSALLKESVSETMTEVKKMSKTLFNFYLDDDVKKKSEEKINRLNGEQSKGQLAALLRVMLKQFIATPDEKVNPLLIQAIEAEYVLSNKRNKRSKM